LFPPQERPNPPPYAKALGFLDECATYAELVAKYPPSVSYRDWFGFVRSATGDSLYRCRFDGVAYVWSSIGAASGSLQFGVRALIEQLGLEALNAPTNTIYRFTDAYNAALETLLLFKNGVLQDTTAVDYIETDDRTITVAPALLAADRLNGIVISDTIGYGGLDGVDRPPAGAGVGPYTVSTAFGDSDELFVWLDGILQHDGVALDYQSDVANNQFTFNAAIGGAVVVCAVVRAGVQGLLSREVFTAQGPFPANVVIADDIDRNNEALLVFINGQLQAENTDYEIRGITTVAITRTILGATHTVTVVRLASSQPQKWRA